jgi:hypothetical protein
MVSANRDEIRDVVLISPYQIFRGKPIGDRLCLAELARRQGAEVPTEFTLA